MVNKMQTPKKRWHSAIEAKKPKRWHWGNWDNHKRWHWGNHKAWHCATQRRKGRRDGNGAIRDCTGATKAQRPKRWMAGAIKAQRAKGDGHRGKKAKEAALLKP